MENIIVTIKGYPLTITGKRGCLDFDPAKEIDIVIRKIDIYQDQHLKWHLGGEMNVWMNGALLGTVESDSIKTGVEEIDKKVSEAIITEINKQKALNDTEDQKKTREMIKETIIKAEKGEL